MADAPASPPSPPPPEKIKPLPASVFFSEKRGDKIKKES
jgi:hypothetical protein